MPTTMRTKVKRKAATPFEAMSAGTFGMPGTAVAKPGGAAPFGTNVWGTPATRPETVYGDTAPATPFTTPVSAPAGNPWDGTPVFAPGATAKQTWEAMQRNAARAAQRRPVDPIGPDGMTSRARSITERLRTLGNDVPSDDPSMSFKADGQSKFGDRRFVRTEQGFSYHPMLPNTAPVHGSGPLQELYDQRNAPTATPEEVDARSQAMLDQYGEPGLENTAANRIATLLQNPELNAGRGAAVPVMNHITADTPPEEAAALTARRDAYKASREQELRGRTIQARLRGMQRGAERSQRLADRAQGGNAMQALFAAAMQGNPQAARLLQTGAINNTQMAIAGMNQPNGARVAAEIAKLQAEAEALKRPGEMASNPDFQRNAYEESLINAGWTPQDISAKMREYDTRTGGGSAGSASPTALPPEFVGEDGMARSPEEIIGIGRAQGMNDQQINDMLSRVHPGRTVDKPVRTWDEWLESMGIKKKVNPKVRNALQERLRGMAGSLGSFSGYSPP